MVSRAKIGISFHSPSIFQTLVLGVANYLVIALEPPNTLRYESSNYAHRPPLSSLQASRQNSFSARQRSLQRACAQASPSFLLDTLHWLSHTSSVAYRFCLSPFQTRHATSRHRDFHSRKFPLVTLCRQSNFANHVHAPALLVLVRCSLCYPALRALISIAFSQTEKWLSLLEIATFSFLLFFFLYSRKIKALHFRFFIIAPLDAPPRRMLFPLFFRKGSRSL
ncbi:hypothetical protein HMPREF9999_00331 [Alloprevotella sp. oral taxon 473 str. F0040]|nr:hypothetical protein HMPREF9999_00331 [Alloprevotella sp. oral taxon 473 str. F0040]